MSPTITNAGRLFDAGAAMLGVRDVVNYEGQAALELEKCAVLAELEAYPVTTINAEQVLLLAGGLIPAVVDDLCAEVPSTIARGSCLRAREEEQHGPSC